MANAEELRRLTGKLGVSLDDLDSVLGNINALFFLGSNPAKDGSVPGLVSDELKAAREEVEGHFYELRGGLEKQFGSVHVEPVMAQVLSDSAELTLIQRIVVGVGEEVPQVEFGGEFGEVLRMPAVGEALLGVAEQLRADPPPAEVWGTERNIQAAWAIGRAGRLTLENAARVRRAAVRRYPPLKGVLSFEEELNRLDKKVEQRLEGLRERGLYVLPEPPLFQPEAPDLPRPGTVTDLTAVRRDRVGPARRGGAGVPVRRKPRGKGPRGGS